MGWSSDGKGRRDLDAESASADQGPHRGEARQSKNSSWFTSGDRVAPVATSLCNSRSTSPTAYAIVPPWLTKFENWLADERTGTQITQDSAGILKVIGGSAL